MLCETGELRLMTSKVYSFSTHCYCFSCLLCFILSTHTASFLLSLPDITFCFLILALYGFWLLFENCGDSRRRQEVFLFFAEAFQTRRSLDIVGPSSSFAELLPPNEPDSVEISSFSDARGKVQNGKTRQRRLRRHRQRRTRRERHGEYAKTSKKEGCGNHDAGFEGIDRKLYKIIESQDEEDEYGNSGLLRPSTPSPSVYGNYAGNEPPIGSALSKFLSGEYHAKDYCEIDMDAIYAEAARVLKLKNQEMDNNASLTRVDCSENHVDECNHNSEVVEESNNPPVTVLCSDQLISDSEENEKHDDGHLLCLDSYWLEFLDDSESSVKDDMCLEAFWLAFLDDNSEDCSEGDEIETLLPDCNTDSHCELQDVVPVVVQKRRCVTFNEGTEVRWHASKPGKGRFSRRAFPSYSGRFCNSALEVEMSDKVVATTTEPLIDHCNYGQKQECPRLTLKERLDRLENEGQDWGYNREQLKDYMFEAWKWILYKASHSDFDDLSEAINEENDEYFLAVDQEHFGSSEIRYTHDLDKNPRTQEECQEGAAILQQEVVLEDSGAPIQNSGCLGFVDVSPENPVHPDDAVMIADNEEGAPQPQFRPRRSPRLASLPAVCYKETPVRRKGGKKKKNSSAQKTKK